jgi:hypothetical protein
LQLLLLEVYSGYIIIVAMAGKLTQSDIERLAVLESEMNSLDKKVDAVDKNVSSLHTKVDTLVSTFHENFVSKGEFDAWKQNRIMERILTVLVTTIITVLISWFIQLNLIK